MPIDASFLDLMPSTVTVYPVSSTNEYGIQTFGVGVDTRCRVQKTGRVVKTADNRDVYENGVIVFYGNPTVTTESKILLPSGETPLIISVQPFNDETGAHHTTISYGSS